MEMSRIVCISPHLDDAVFSCGSFLAAAALHVPVLVITVCAGSPSAEFPVSQLDSGCGFRTSAEAIAARRREDSIACGTLGARVLHLDVVDNQYDDEKHEHHIRAVLAPILAVAGTVLAPVGIRHPDHILVAQALRGRADYLYAELPYRVLWPDESPRLPSPALELATSPAKEAAIRCYRSQIPDGSNVWGALSASERYYSTDSIQ